MASLEETERTLCFDIWRRRKKRAGNKKTLNCIFFLTLLPRETRVKGIFSTTSTCNQNVKGLFSTKNENILHQKVKDFAYLKHIHIFHPPSDSKKKTELKKEHASSYFSFSLFFSFESDWETWWTFSQN